MGVRDMTKPALAGDDPPTLNHAVRRARPGVAKHPVVAIIRAQTRGQLARRPAPPVAIRFDCLHETSRETSDPEIKQSLSLRLFPLASSADFRPEGTIGRLAAGVWLCHIGRRTVGRRVATCCVESRSGVVVACRRLASRVGQRCEMVAKRTQAREPTAIKPRWALRGYRARPGYFPATSIALYVRTRFFMRVHSRVRVSIGAK